MKKAALIVLIIMLYATLFLYTGICKIMDYSIIKEQLAMSPVLAPVSKLIAAGLPWIEFLVVLLLVIPRWRLKGFYASLALMTAFTIYIIGMLIFDKHLPCSCGGVIEKLSWKGHIVFNSVFIVLSIIGIILEKQVQKANQITYDILHKKDLAI